VLREPRDVRARVHQATGRKQLAPRAAADFDAFYDARAAVTPAEAGKTAPILVLTTDGKGVVMRPEALREATRKAAGKRERKLRKRLTKGEKTATRRMATVASVYTIEPFYRTPEDIVRDLDADRRETVPRPRPEHKRVWASVAKEPAEVIEQMFAEAERRDPQHRKAWVVLVDGNEAQLRLIRETAERRGVQISIVLDVIHVIEYLWGAAYSFHAEGTSEAEQWVTERLLHILRGKSSDVAAGIRRSATLRGLDAHARAAAEIARTTSSSTARTSTITCRSPPESRSPHWRHRRRLPPSSRHPIHRSPALDHHPQQADPPQAAQATPGAIAATAVVPKERRTQVSLRSPPASVPAPIRRGPRPNPCDRKRNPAT
jgi:hypothetical protein